jgi:hypothetical protein
VAMATRQKALDAYVTEVHTRVPAAGICLRGLQVRMAAPAAVNDTAAPAGTKHRNCAAAQRAAARS